MKTCVTRDFLLSGWFIPDCNWIQNTKMLLSLAHRNGLKTQCYFNMFHTSIRSDTNRDFNEYHHADRGATFKQLRKQIYQPLFQHLQAKEKARLAEQEKFETVAFTPPVMSDEVIMRMPDKIQTIEQVCKTSRSIL